MESMLFSLKIKRSTAILLHVLSTLDRFSYKGTWANCRYLTNYKHT